MSIESTKKLIVTTIVAIMILAVTTPTFAAGFDFRSKLGETLGTVKGFVNQATEGISKIDIGSIKEGITSGIGKISDSFNKIDVSSILKNDSGKDLFDFSLPTASENGKETNLFDSIKTGFGKIGDFFKPKEEADDDKNPSGIKDIANVGQGFEFIKNKTTELANNVKNMFTNKDGEENKKGTIQETIENAKSKTKTLFGNIVQEGLIGGLKSYFNKDETEGGDEGALPQETGIKGLAKQLTGGITNLFGGIKNLLGINNTPAPETTIEEKAAEEEQVVGYQPKTGKKLEFLEGNHVSVGGYSRHEDNGANYGTAFVYNVLNPDGSIAHDKVEKKKIKIDGKEVEVYTYDGYVMVGCSDESVYNGRYKNGKAEGQEAVLDTGDEQYDAIVIDNNSWKGSPGSAKYTYIDLYCVDDTVSISNSDDILFYPTGTYIEIDNSNAL